MYRYAEDRLRVMLMLSTLFFEVELLSETEDHHFGWCDWPVSSWDLFVTFL